MDKILEKGFMVEITSWENDADYYKTEVVEYDEPTNITIEDLKRLKSFLEKYLVSGCNKRFEYKGQLYPCYGNGRNNNMTILQDIWEESNLKCFDDYADEWICEYIGYTERGGGGYRVYESMKVYEVPEKITLKEIQL